MCTAAESLPERHRMEGFIESCRAHGIANEDILVVSQSEGQWSEGTCDGCDDLFASKDPPTAVFGSNDIKALRIIRLLRRRGWSVPEDVSVIGYDDIDISSIVVPSLTTIHQPVNEMIEAGILMLLDLVAGKGVVGARPMAKPWLVERESTKRR